jgi:hypothetical protein
MILKHLTSLTLAAIVIQAVPAHGQSSAREDAVLTEVRLLRQAIETLAGTNARVQIVLAGSNCRISARRRPQGDSREASPNL